MMLDKLFDWRPGCTAPRDYALFLAKHPCGHVFVTCLSADSAELAGEWSPVLIDVQTEQNQARMDTAA